MGGEALKAILAFSIAVILLAYNNFVQLLKKYQ